MMCFSPILRKWPRFVFFHPPPQRRCTVRRKSERGRGLNVKLASNEECKKQSEERRQKRNGMRVDKDGACTCRRQRAAGPRATDTSVCYICFFKIVLAMYHPQ